MEFKKEEAMKNAYALEKGKIYVVKYLGHEFTEDSIYLMREEFKKVGVEAALIRVNNMNSFKVEPAAEIGYVNAGIDKNKLVMYMTKGKVSEGEAPEGAVVLPRNTKVVVID